ncbi:MAG TPA: hypothetical protein VGO36_05040 [Solirubrobacterales bacterium]|nr:hypothetical protein [Solirubrobacterales bacterium]
MGTGNKAFVICQIGDDDSPVRQRADEIFSFIVEPIVEEFDLHPTRSDRDPTPGQITAQIIRSLTGARLVVADLTGRNPNVYYELGVAHSFGIPVVILVDEVGSLSFDASQERVIELGAQERLGVADAEKAKKKLRESLRVVLADGYIPSSLVSEAAGSRSLQDLAPDNPIATELAFVRSGVEQLLQKSHRERLSRTEPDFQVDAHALYDLLEGLAKEKRLSQDALTKIESEIEGTNISDDLRRSLKRFIRADKTEDPF